MSQSGHQTTSTTTLPQLSMQKGAHAFTPQKYMFGFTYGMEDRGFIPLALVGFVGLAGIAAWLGQPMLCDLCIAEVFFIGNQIVKNGTPRRAIYEAQPAEKQYLENIKETRKESEDVKLVEGVQVHSKQTSLLEPSQTTDSTAQATVPKTGNTVSSAEQPTVLPNPIPERIEYIVQPDSHSISAITNDGVLVSEPPPIVESEVCISPSSNPIPERVEYISKKPRPLSFSPPTPPVSPPREPFAQPVPVDMRLPSPPVPSSILTPPLSPQIPPVDYFVGLDGVTQTGPEHDEMNSIEFENAWKQNTAASGLVANTEEASPERVAHQDSETDQQLQDQLREAFDDELPVVTHVEDITVDKDSNILIQDEDMESSMVVVITPDMDEQKRDAVENQLPSPSTDTHSQQTLSPIQQKPAFIILTPEKDEEKVLYDANNSRASSIDARITPAPAEESEVEAAQVVSPPAEHPQIITTPPRTNDVVFCNPFSSSNSEPEQEVDKGDMVQPAEESIVLSTTSVAPVENHEEKPSSDQPHVEVVQEVASPTDETITEVIVEEKPCNDQVLMKAELKEAELNEAGLAQEFSAHEDVKEPAPELAISIQPLPEVFSTLSREDPSFTEDFTEKPLSEGKLPEAPASTPEASTAVEQKPEENDTEVMPEQSLEVVKGPYVEVDEPELQTAMEESPNPVTPPVVTSAPAIPEDTEMKIPKLIIPEDVNDSQNDAPQSPSGMSSRPTSSAGSHQETVGSSSSIQRSASGAVRLRGWIKRRFSSK
ncbi:hypothetical protein BDZ91DRAFT_780532, partial [Kalaharituber pfeilii]